MLMDNGLSTDGGCDVGFAGAWTANENDVLRVIQEPAAMQRLDLAFGDSAFLELEASKITIGRELGNLHLQVDRTYLAFSDLGLYELIEELTGLLKCGRCLLGKRCDGTRHAMELHRLERGSNSFSGHG